MDFKETHMKYIFKQIDDISGHNAETTVEFSADTLTSVLNHVQMFLSGSGFQIDGYLDVVNDEEIFENDNRRLSKELTPVHSHYYYDTERNKPIQQQMWFPFKENNNE